ncbi:divergent polysaccharide deacetylase family protein [Hydrogenimonas sp.]
MATRKPSSRKPSSGTARKRTRNTRKRKSTLSGFKLYLFAGSVGLLVLATLLGLAGWVGYEAGREKGKEACEKLVVDYRKDIRELRKKLAARPAEASHRAEARKSPPPPPPGKHHAKPAAAAKEPSEVRDYLEAGGEEGSRKTPPKERVALRKPKLVIIIDDVAYASQVRAIRRLPWHITPSIFPPTSRHPDTPRIASKLKHYMIHLPMEAMRYNNPEEETLTVSDSAEKIDRRLAQIRRWFPTAHFINNHTGSRFTSDMAAMKRFYPAARRYGFVFVDSRTTPKTVVPRLCETAGRPYIARDIFLDNRADTAYIQNQLKKAVKLAKAHGYAIAIGHPHASTLKALAASSPILDGVDVVYIDELYKKIR